MDRNFLPLCSLLIGVLVAISNAALLPSQEYWHTVLPNTHMPTALSDLLPSDSVRESESTGTYVNVGKGRVNVHAHTGKPGATTVGVSKGGVHVVAGKGTPGGTTVNVGKGGGVYVGAGNGKPGSTTVHTGPGGVTVNVKPKYGQPGHSVTVGDFSYHYAATDEQLHKTLRNNFFFLEQDLRPGFKINVRFDGRDNDGVKFLSKSEADRVPFSSEKMPEILSQFEPGSEKEEAMRETLRECEDAVLDGEKKTCATSLESMVDFCVASLGTKNIRAVSTTVHSKKTETPKQEYTITSSGVKPFARDGELVACHQQPYAYAVFYCHKARSTRGYTVRMTGGKDGTVVDAVAVCHTDTATWNPKHVSFQVLNVKPGTVPVCHFLPQDHVVFNRGD